MDEELIEGYWEKINYCFVGANAEAECKDSVKKIIKQLLQSQRKVTRNKIEIGASILLNPLDVTAEEIHVFEEMLINWFKELGIEVTDNTQNLSSHGRNDGNVADK